MDVPLSQPVYSVEECTSVELDSESVFSAIKTPGHTPDHLCFCV